jgi:hypothetical protein
MKEMILEYLNNGDHEPMPVIEYGPGARKIS